MYRKETEDQQRKVDKYIADAADEWDIKTQVCLFCTRIKICFLLISMGMCWCVGWGGGELIT